MNKKIYDIDPEQLIIRDHLAADRTALALVAGGVGLIKIFEGQLVALIIGWIFVPIGLVIIIFGTIRFLKIRSAIKKIGFTYILEEKENEN